MAKLGPAEISEKLKSLPGWEQKDNAISKRYKFKEFLDGIHVIDEIAQVAERMDHHPDIAINYTRITFTCTTHDQGGITEKDFKLAGEIEQAAKRTGQT